MYAKSRDIVRQHRTNESMATRMDSVCISKDPCWDGLTWTPTFDTVKPKLGHDEPPSAAEVAQQVMAAVAEGAAKGIAPALNDELAQLVKALTRGGQQ